MVQFHQFADNLREQCKRYPSIAEVCRGIGINRQQFNRYLAGQALPNASTLRKICTFFGTTEQILLSPPHRDENSMWGRYRQRLSTSLEHLAALSFPDPRDYSNEASKRLTPGLYFGYFPLLNKPTHLIRTLISIAIVKDLTVFSRLTKIPDPLYPSRHLIRGKHVGVVLATKNEVNFIARNRVAPYQLSVMTFDMKNVTNDIYFFGVGLTRGSAETVAVRIVLEKLSTKVDRRCAIKLAQPVELNDPSVSPMVRAALLPHLSSNDSFLKSRNLDSLVGIAETSSENAMSPNYRKIPAAVNDFES